MCSRSPNMQSQDFLGPPTPTTGIERAVPIAVVTLDSLQNLVGRGGEQLRGESKNEEGKEG